MKRLLSASVCFLICLSALFSPAFALDSSETERITFEDGSYAIVEQHHSGAARATSYDSEAYTYYTPLGQKCFTYTLYATFTYNGVTSQAKTSVAIIDLFTPDWECSSHNEYTLGRTAYGKATFSGPNDRVIPVSLTLTCDKNGNVT